MTVVSIHALLAECDVCDCFGEKHKGQFQSTHSLRSATPEWAIYSLEYGVSIHALLAECDTRPEKLKQSWKLFQSTHSLRSATACTRAHVTSTQFQSTHSLRSATPSTAAARLSMWFQSTHSLRSATSGKRAAQNRVTVSIHALLAECDILSGDSDSATCEHGFNPRTPCGVRLRPTLYIATQQSKSYFAPTSLKRPSLHGCSF